MFKVWTLDRATHTNGRDKSGADQISAHQTGESIPSEQREREIDAAPNWAEASPFTEEPQTVMHE